MKFPPSSLEMLALGNQPVERCIWTETEAPVHTPGLAPVAVIPNLLAI